MQLSIQVIRGLGFKKINKMYLSGDKKVKFFKALENLNTRYGAMRLVPYSFMDKWSLIEDYDKDNEFAKLINGYVLFTFSIEPLSEVKLPTPSAKRKCRNTWNSIWNSFGLVNNLTDSEVCLLKDFGIKLAFIYASYKLNTEELTKLCKDSKLKNEETLEMIEKFVGFYNSVLSWNALSQQELNFIKNGKEPEDVLEILVAYGSKDFRDFLDTVI